MKRVILSAVVVVVLLFVFALPAMAQEQQPFCDWYWYYKFNPSGGWEYWCWDPQDGWWYAESEDGTKRSVALRGSGVVLLR